MVEFSSKELQKNQMQHYAEHYDDALERRLLRELAIVNQRIVELQAEKLTLERLLIRLRKSSVDTGDVTRKNSAGRLLVENAIIDRLQSAGERGVPTLVLWKVARDAHPHLKEATFRSHLHRLKSKGLIESPVYSYWRVPLRPPLEGA